MSDVVLQVKVRTDADQPQVVIEMADGTESPVAAGDLGEFAKKLEAVAPGAAEAVVAPIVEYHEARAAELRQIAGNSTTPTKPKSKPKSRGRKPAAKPAEQTTPTKGDNEPQAEKSVTAVPQPDQDPAPEAEVEPVQSPNGQHAASGQADDGPARRTAAEIEAMIAPGGQAPAVDPWAEDEF